MDLAKRNCFGPPLVSLTHALVFGVAASLLLSAWWRRFGTAALLAPWGLLAAGGAGYVAVRVATFGGWELANTLASMVQLVLASLLLTLASAAVWGVMPRAPLWVHAAISLVQFVIAFLLATFVASGVEEWIDAVRVGLPVEYLP